MGSVFHNASASVERGRKHAEKNETKARLIIGIGKVRSCFKTSERFIVVLCFPRFP